MTGVAVPTPPIIGSVNKTAKIGDGYKIIHSKYCPNGKFNNVYKQKNAPLLSVVARWYINSFNRKRNKRPCTDACFFFVVCFVIDLLFI